MKHYPAQFKADTVALYRSRPDATIAQVADDLGINREKLRSWIRVDEQRRGGGGLVRPAAEAVVTGSVEAENAELRRGGVNSRRSATFCVRRPGISPGDALVTRFQFVADHSQRCGVKRLCQIVGVARSSFYHWLATAPARAV